MGISQVKSDIHFKTVFTCLARKQDNCFTITYLDKHHKPSLQINSSDRTFFLAGTSFHNNNKSDDDNDNDNDNYNDNDNDNINNNNKNDNNNKHYNNNNTFI